MSASRRIVGEILNEAGDTVIFINEQYRYEIPTALYIKWTVYPWSLNRAIVRRKICVANIEHLSSLYRALLGVIVKPLDEKKIP